MIRKQTHEFKPSSRVKSCLAILGICLLSACSGGGGGSSPAAIPISAPPPIVPPPTTSTPDTTVPDSTTPDTSIPDSSIPDMAIALVLIPEISNESFLLSSGSRSLVSAAPNASSGNNVLACAVGIKERQGCSFEALPLIGMVTTNPTVEDIMTRVVVSHDWMRVRFEEILNQMPTEVLLLMRGLTAIVISYDIRPSFYYPYTGAIYLDPNGMWLTEEERAVIDETPDFRSEFGSQLQFIILWRYVMGNTDIRAFDRDLTFVSIKTAALLFHELAHANDFFSPSRVNSIDRTVAPIDAITDLESDRLKGTFPLLSSTMSGLARVSFRGATATTLQQSFTSSDIAGEFPADTANDYYNYNTQFEDLAMAFEEAMMYHSFGISRDVAVTNFPESNSCEQYLVAWGQRNRIGDPSIQARSMYTVRALLPEVADNVAASLANMPAPKQMTVDTNWCANINLSAPNQRGLSNSSAGSVNTVESLIPYQ